MIRPFGGWSDNSSILERLPPTDSMRFVVLIPSPSSALIGMLFIESGLPASTLLLGVLIIRMKVNIFVSQMLI